MKGDCIMSSIDKKNLRLLYLAQIFWNKTDIDQGITAAEIRTKLENQGITVSRKTLYNDIALLVEFGMDITKQQRNKNFYYHLVHRTFELSELKILVDIAQSARFLTDKKTELLIEKLESLTNNRAATQLHRHVRMAGRVKTSNEEIYYNVDKIYSAIENDVQISFKYYQWTPDKARANRHNNKTYVISPGNLLWDNENYYMLGYDAEVNKIKHYRVDKMLSICILSDSRIGKDLLESIDIAKYEKSIFGMYDGEPTTVMLQCDNRLANPIFDKFGTDIQTWPRNDGTFLVNVDVIVSNQFLGWLFGLGDGIKIISPISVIARYKEAAQHILNSHR